jgi:hypothetical protein
MGCLSYKITLVCLFVKNSVFIPVEAIVTGGIFAYLQRTQSSLIKADTQNKKEGKIWFLWGALGLTAAASPIGLLASSTAWGEWGVDELQNLGLNFIPEGIEQFSGWWPAPLPDYGIPRMGAVIGYILCAFIGIALVGSLLWLLARWLSRLNSVKSASKAGATG